MIPVKWGEATRVTKPVRQRIAVPHAPSKRAGTTVQSKPILVIPQGGDQFGGHSGVLSYIARFEDLNHLVRTV